MRILHRSLMIFAFLVGMLMVVGMWRSCTSEAENRDYQEQVLISPGWMAVDRLSQFNSSSWMTIERWHDRKSGVEFICIRDRGCVLTGRNWKGVEEPR